MTFNIQQNFTESSVSKEDYFIVLKFSLNHALPSGACVIPILSLPIHVYTDMRRKELSYGDHVEIFDDESKSKSYLNFDSKKVTQNIVDKCYTQQNSNEIDINVKKIMNIDKLTCASCIRESLVGDVIIYVLESPGMLGIGGKVWDSTYVLVDFLMTYGSSLVAGKRVVELGSGTGITGTYIY